MRLNHLHEDPNRAVTQSNMRVPLSYEAEDDLPPDETIKSSRPRRKSTRYIKNMPAYMKYDSSEIPSSEKDTNIMHQSDEFDSRIDTEKDINVFDEISDEMLDSETHVPNYAKNPANLNDIRLTHPKAFVGTPAYMAPEKIKRSVKGIKKNKHGRYAATGVTGKGPETTSYPLPELPPFPHDTQNPKRPILDPLNQVYHVLKSEPFGLSFKEIMQKIKPYQDWLDNLKYPIKGPQKYQDAMTRLKNTGVIAHKNGMFYLNKDRF